MWDGAARVDAGDLARAWEVAAFPGMARKYNYRRNLPHIQKDFRQLFVFFNTNARWELPPEARDIVLQSCLYQHTKMVWIHAVVIMPEHVHIIFTPLLDENGPYSIPEVLQNIKSVSSRRINKALVRSGRVWQEESFDHVLRSEEKLADRIEYLRQNPVRRGLCRRPEQYRWLWVNPKDFVYGECGAGEVARVHTGNTDAN